MKKRNVISILLYLLGVALFVISNSAVVSGSPIHLTYFQRVVLCGAAVCSIGTAPLKQRKRIQTTVQEMSSCGGQLHPQTIDPSSHGLF